jgi:hypothetical protein
MFDTDVMDRVSLLYEWRNDSVNALQLLIRDCKTLAAFATYSFIFLLSILGVIEMAPQLAAMSLRTSVADIRRLQKSKAMTLYVFSTEFITIIDAGATVFQRSEQSLPDQWIGVGTFSIQHQYLPHMVVGAAIPSACTQW